MDRIEAGRCSTCLDCEKREVCDASSLIVVHTRALFFPKKKRGMVHGMATEEWNPPPPCERQHEHGGGMAAWMGGGRSDGRMGTRRKEFVGRWGCSFNAPPLCRATRAHFNFGRAVLVVQREKTGGRSIYVLPCMDRITSACPPATTHRHRGLGFRRTRGAARRGAASRVRSARHLCLSPSVLPSAVHHPPERVAFSSFDEN
jgi:hypothetical protein